MRRAIIKRHSSSEEEAEILHNVGEFAIDKVLLTPLDTACLLVPPDHRIVSATDVLTPELRAAIGRVNAYLNAELIWKGSRDPSDGTWEQMREAHRAITPEDRSLLNRVKLS